MTRNSYQNVWLATLSRVTYYSQQCINVSSMICWSVHSLLFISSLRTSIYAERSEVWYYKIILFNLLRLTCWSSSYTGIRADRVSGPNLLIQVCTERTVHQKKQYVSNRILLHRLYDNPICFNQLYDNPIYFNDYLGFISTTLRFCWMDFGFWISINNNNTFIIIIIMLL